VRNVLNVERTPATASSDGRVRVFVDSAVGADVRADLAATIVKGGWGLYQLRNVGMSLEEVFLQLTTQEEHDLPVEDDEVEAELETVEQ
jgi:ABC-2 type transport system ATP-binding protein